MHIGNILSYCKTQLCSADGLYTSGRKGDAAETLSKLGKFLREELPGKKLPEYPPPEDSGPAGPPDATDVLMSSEGCSHPDQKKVNEQKP